MFINEIVDSQSILAKPQMSNEKSPMLLESQACDTHVILSEDAWYANTIASQHMTNNKHWF